MTRELLRLMPPNGLLLAFEISPSFVRYLRESIPDARLQVVPSGAETAANELRRRHIMRVDGIVSSLGLGMMESEAADAVFRPLLPWLQTGGPITQFQYIHRLRLKRRRLERFDASAFLGQYFHSVRSTRVWLNIPPADVLTCRGARETVAAGSPQA